MIRNFYRSLYFTFAKKIFDIYGRFFHSTYYANASLKLPLINHLFQYGYASCESLNFSSDCNDELQKLFDSAYRNSYKIFDQNCENLSTGSKLYLRNLLVDLSIDEAADIIAFFVSNAMLGIASSYLKCTPLLTEIKLLYSPSSNSDTPLSGSQLFHKDFDDVKNLKIFINLSDITLEDGPLQIFDRGSSQEIADNIKRLCLKVSTHSDKVEELSSKPMISLIGKRGAINFVDTCCCYHRGSRNPLRSRLVLYATYNSRTSFRFPPFHWFGLKKRNLTSWCPLRQFNLPIGFYSIFTQN